MKDDLLPVDQLEKLSKRELINLVKRDMVRVTMTAQTLIIMPMTKYDTHEYQKHVHLNGVAITLSEASRKYDLPLTTVHNWVRTGLIEIIGKEKNRILLNESDVAYCSEVRKNNPGQGKWLFNPDGTPYTPKTDCE
jgi:hypothetical protein